MLICSDYRKLCEQKGFVFDGDNPSIPPSGLVYVPLDRITEFFKICNYTQNKYIVVSALSDYGIEKQIKKTVSSDMFKWINFILDKVPDLKYEPLMIPARCNIEECKLSDRYSVKMYSFTKSTFDVIPNNVLWWFSTNLNVDLPRTTKIPFGIAEWTHQYISRKYIVAPHKVDKLYVNFQTNTVERFTLMRGLKGKDWCTVESGLSHEEYVNAIRRHKWVLCPEGNGLDSYRIMETLAVGSIPVMVKDTWNECYENFPKILLDNWNSLCYNTLKDSEGNFDGVQKDYWLSQIEEKLNDS